MLLTVAAAAALYAGLVGVGGVARADAWLLHEAVDIRTPIRTLAATAVTHIGSTVSMRVLALSACLWLLHRRRVADAVFLGCAAAGGSLLFNVLKYVLRRARPPGAGPVEVANSSLPSGHATMAVVVLGALVLLAWPALRAAGRTALVAGAGLWAGAVGLSRIYLGVHWFTDVVAGWLVGAAWLAWCVTVWTWWRARRSRARAS